MSPIKSCRLSFIVCLYACFDLQEDLTASNAGLSYLLLRPEFLRASVTRKIKNITQHIVGQH